MAENSAITWCDHTFNPWIGCTNVSPACDNCYAERDNNRRHWVPSWGPGQPRKRTSISNWNKVLKWERDASEFYRAHGHWPRVFSASLADIFDNEVDPEWRDDFWRLVRMTPHLQWIVVTKRIGLASKAGYLPDDWGSGYANVVLTSTVADQAEFGRDWRKLSDTPARWRGLSIEPQLGEITLADRYPGTLDWAIIGFESGPADRVRMGQLSWATSLIDECQSSGTAFHLKQLGKSVVDDVYDGTIIRFDHHAGADWNEWAEHLRIRQFPPQMVF